MNPISHQTAIDQIILFVKKQLENAEPGHDWWHIYRVWNLAKKIGQNYPVNQLLLEAGALLHDIADAKFHNGDEEKGPLLVKNVMTKIKIDNHIIDKTIQIMRYISFKNLGEKYPDFIEFKIIQDADRLDAIGAIGIARAFSYGGYKKRTMYDPDKQPFINMTSEEYKINQGPTINHFYEKLLKLKDLLNTPEAILIAEKRHIFMNQYLDRFYIEWNASDI